MPTILLVERENASDPSLTSSTRRRSVTIVMENDFRNAVANMGDYEPDLIVLDTASMRTSGVLMVHQLIRAGNGVALIRIAPDEAISTNSHESEFLLIHPLSLRRLKTLVGRLLPPDPEDELRIGLFCLDPNSRTIRANGRCTLLTPKAMALLLYLQKNEGRLVARKRLLKHVWDGLHWRHAHDRHPRELAA